MKKIWLVSLTVLLSGLWNNPCFAATTADEYYRQGCNYYEEKKFDEAAKSFEKAVGLKPDNAIYHYNLGITYCDLGKYEGALKHLEKARDLAPDSQVEKYAKQQIAEIKKYYPIKSEEGIKRISGMKKGNYEYSFEISSSFQMTGVVGDIGDMPCAMFKKAECILCILITKGIEEFRKLQTFSQEMEKRGNIQVGSMSEAMEIKRKHERYRQSLKDGYECILFPEDTNIKLSIESIKEGDYIRISGHSGHLFRKEVATEKSIELRSRKQGANQNTPVIFVKSIGKKE